MGLQVLDQILYTMRYLWLILFLPLSGFSQITDTCQVEFEFDINNENRHVKFSQKDYEVNILTFLWDFGDGTSSVINEPTHAYSQTGTYIVCLTVTTDNNCFSTFCDTVVIEAIPFVIYNLSGTVITNTSVLPFGFALLVKKDNNNFIYSSVAPVIDGHYYFTDIDPGVYFVHIIPVFDISGYYFPFYLPTYAGNRILWQQAQPVYVYSNNTIQNIQLCSFNGIITGEQSLHGKITYSSNDLYEEDIFNMDWLHQTPLQNLSQNAINIPVLLFDAMGNCIKAVLTDFSGEFLFENIPYGKYFVSAEKAGVLSGMIPINIQSSGDSQNICYITLNAGGFVGLNNIVYDQNTFVVYPVPADDFVYFPDATKDICQLSNALGGIIMNIPAGTKQIDISALPDGIYYISCSDGKSAVIVKE